MTIICLDKGHTGKLSGQDCGCVGNGLYESDLTDIIVEGITKRLQDKYDVNVKIVPRGSLNDRTNYANSINADYFLSVHINAGGGFGFESHIYTSPSVLSVERQKIIHSEIMNYLKQFNIRDRGMKNSNFAVLRQTNMSSILLENLFIDNANDAKLLKDSKFLDGLSNAICYGLVLALGLKLKDNIETNKENNIKVIQNNNINILNTKNSVNIIIDEQKLNIDNYIIDDHIYVPLKDICDTFQKEYKWDGGKREIIIIK